MLCSVCGLRRETAVLTCMDKPPEILMLHLKRWVEMCGDGDGGGGGDGDGDDTQKH